MEHQTNGKGRVAAMLALFLLSSAGALKGGDAKADDGKFLLVQIRPRNFLATPSKVKPGTVRVMVENFTMIVSPTLSIRPQNPGNALDGVKLDKPQPIRPRESWHEVVLKPGTYWVSLDQDPEAKAQLIVEP